MMAKKKSLEGREDKVEIKAKTEKGEDLEDQFSRHYII